MSQSGSDFERRVRGMTLRLAGWVLLAGGGLVLVLALALSHWAGAPAAKGHGLDPRGIDAMLVVGLVLGAIGLAGLAGSLWLGTPARSPAHSVAPPLHPQQARAMRARLILFGGLAVLILAVFLRLHGGL